MSAGQCRWPVLPRVTGAAFLGGALLLAACGGGGGVSVEDTVTAPSADGWSWSLPANFPVPRVPQDNPLSEAKVELGRHLFYDRRLSGNGTQACASCHQQDKAFTDGLARSIGSTGDMHPRNAQSLANVVYNATFTWANPSLLSLESQLQVPLFGDSPVEMGVNDGNVNEVLGRIRGDARYPAMFAAAYGSTGEVVTWSRITQAIASFQRTLISGNSKYDQALQGKAALTPAELRGQTLFFGEKAECFHCHASHNFNDQVVHAATRVISTPFHNTGLYNIGGTGNFPEGNQGLFEFTFKPEDRGLFRAQSLRNVEVTAPYMHDGSIATLEEVLDFYAAGGRRITTGPYAGDGRFHPNKSDLISLIDLNEQEKADIVAFLKTLTDHDFLNNPKFADPFRP
ncbi:methanobactin export MATE transporter MbnM [Hydrogenophaga sp.]|uniref:methanobactin export MATE transporter MbnM n=1 Tax=Hydrogenophaga sp. TaxID=1904254 RepID=UPI00260EF0FD|nr:methanobactin export MATE transporter MbnM [Hydrogenophaga sp.]MCW5653122.1 di-heme enzyme [Hydrogenophaga sp.]